MGKYEPLTSFLRRQTADEVRLTFAQIERVIGAKLPPKAQLQRAWWSNSASNNVLTKAWLVAGFRSEQVDIEGRQLVFRRASSGSAQGVTEVASAGSAGIPKRHPLIGALKGWIKIASGTDLTEPADPEWGERAWGEQE
jgi:hypothetical protein